jgi:hypothetical protein
MEKAVVMVGESINYLASTEVRVTALRRSPDAAQRNPGYQRAKVTPDSAALHPGYVGEQYIQHPRYTLFLPHLLLLANATPSLLLHSMYRSSVLSWWRQT